MGLFDEIDHLGEKESLPVFWTSAVMESSPLMEPSMTLEPGLFFHQRRFFCLNGFVGRTIVMNTKAFVPSSDK
ncbi:MAG: hypothetical protein WBB23_22790 [Desulforhopalus sp.]